jgi:hypothetical protein
LNSRAPGLAACNRGPASAQATTPARAQQQPLPFHRADVGTLLDIAEALEHGGAVIRANRVRALAVRLAHALAGAELLELTTCDVGDVWWSLRARAVPADVARAGELLAWRMLRTLDPAAPRAARYAVLPSGALALLEDAPPLPDPLEAGLVHPPASPPGDVRSSVLPATAGRSDDAGAIPAPGTLSPDEGDLLHAIAGAGDVGTWLHSIAIDHVGLVGEALRVRGLIEPASVSAVPLYRVTARGRELLAAAGGQLSLMED